MIWIVKRNVIEHRMIDEISVSEVGQKALGLCHMPKAWTLPFFIIDREMFVEICNSEKKDELLSAYMKYILNAIMHLNLGTKIIIRSSGEKEGMAERGAYESIIVEDGDIKSALLQLVENLQEFEELRKNGMPFIVQTYIDSEIVGHVSNERRFSKDKRDFIFEYKKGDCFEVETGRIALRDWREKIEIQDFLNENLRVKDGLKNILKVVCSYMKNETKRVHIEFVSNGEKLFLVQCDYESENSDAVNPTEYDISMTNLQNFVPRVLRKIDESDRGKYKKIDNVFIYKEIGEPIPPLFILDEQKCLEELRRGEISEDLSADIEFMVNHSLVIRTNINSSQIVKTQFSQRSNELRSFEEAKDFLIATSQELEKEVGTNYVFILHNFIPAKIAAFVNAKPMERIVEIQCLWGLPEGLYYNSHDRIVVDTMEINIEKMDRMNFKVTKKVSFKENFIAPNADGKWVVQKLKQPYDWNCTMDDDKEIADIAYRARKIAEYVNEELSIMWFVGIDSKYYDCGNMPWYHENYNRDIYYYTSKSNSSKRYKKKYFYEQEVIVSNEEDIEKIKGMNAREIGLVRIQPKDDILLRSKGFIKRIGVLCKEKGINIFLEGAALAHSYYQLISTGATVLSSYEIKEYEESIEYKKLVRDEIPEIIRDKGENVKCVCIKGVGLIWEIKNKLIEEAYEVYEACDRESIIEELADLEEVCMALEENFELISMDKYKNDEVVKENLVFDVAVCSHRKQYKFISLNGKDTLVTVERRSSNIQIDFIVGEKTTRLFDELDECKVDVKKKILKDVFSLMTISTVDDVKAVLSEIRAERDEILNIYSCSIDEFDKVRIDKLKKKGAFKKGYVLWETTIQEKRTEQLEGVSLIGEPIDIFEIPQEYKIDIDLINGNRLLIRMNFPIYIRKNKWRIKRKKISNYFGEDIDLRISKQYIGTKMFLGIDIEKSNYEQIELNL